MIITYRKDVPDHQTLIQSAGAEPERHIQKNAKSDLVKNIICAPQSVRLYLKRDDYYL
jgi:hypothetical protein